MPETYEKDGVIYFKEPYRTNMTEWLESHIDCDVLATDVDFNNCILSVIAYPSCSENNGKLIKLKSAFKNARVLQGMLSEEVDCID